MAEEIKNQGQQENAENLNENVSGQAKEIISAALEETQNRETSPVLKADSNVTDKFKGPGISCRRCLRLPKSV